MVLKTFREMLEFYLKRSDTVSAKRAKLMLAAHALEKVNTEGTIIARSKVINNLIGLKVNAEEPFPFCILSQFIVSCLPFIDEESANIARAAGVK